MTMPINTILLKFLYFAFLIDVEVGFAIQFFVTIALNWKK